MSNPSSAVTVLGRRARRHFDVRDVDTAIAVGSGSVPVLGTPRMLAWMEAVAVAALDPALVAGEVSVGTHAELDHLRPSAVGSRVIVDAVVSAVDGQRVDCDVDARDDQGTVVARGRISRMVVDRQRFLDRLAPSTSDGTDDSIS